MRALPRRFSRVSPQSRLIAFGAALWLGAGCGSAPPPDAQFVAEWMRNYYGLIRTERISPPVAARVLAYASVALHEGLAISTPGMRSLAGRLNGLDSLPRGDRSRRYDPVLVALAAEHRVLDTLFVEALPPTRVAVAALADSLWNARTALGVSARVADDSRALGDSIGAAVLAWAATDGFDETRTRPFKPVAGPQYWLNDSRVDEYTPQNLNPVSDYVAYGNPAAMLQGANASERALAVTRPKDRDIRTLKAANPAGATEPWFGMMRPFVLTSASECPTPPPAPWSTAKGSAFHAQAMAVYDAGRTLTDEQRQTVLYWADNPGQTGTPVGHWLAIGSQLVRQKNMTTAQAAEMFVVMTLAQADAFIAIWHEKYRLSLIRPVTYIRRHIDSTWTPAIVTPAFPEHPSGHSGQSAAAATVLTALLGNVAFEDSTNLALGHGARRYQSFHAAADEAAISRLYGGIHFPNGNEHGKTLGRCVGDKALLRLHATNGDTR